MTDVVIQQEVTTVTVNETGMLVIEVNGGFPMSATIDPGGATNEVLVSQGLSTPPIWTSSLANINSVAFDTTPTAIPTVGQLTWNDTDGTLDLGLKGSNVTLQVGQEQVQRVVNGAGTALTDGQVVYVTGAQGQRVKVSLASNASELTSSDIIGVVTEPIADNQEGFVTTQGLVRGVNTNSFNEGDSLWLGVTPGTMTNIHPIAPAHAVFIGTVVNKGITNGSIYVHPSPGFELDEIHDVLFSSPTTGQPLVYDNGLWKNNTTLNIGATDTTLNSSLVVPKTSGTGIKVDVATPTYSWVDVIGQLLVRGTPVGTDPSFNVFRGVQRAYQFTVNDFVEFAYHIPHDYVPGSDIYAHIHWAHNNAAITTGSVTWELTHSYAKGHSQAQFTADKVLTITQTAPTGATGQWRHMIAEGQLSTPGGSATMLDSTLIEADGLILIRARLTSNTMNGAPEPFMFVSDLHIQSTAIGTKNKSPSPTFWS